MTDRAEIETLLRKLAPEVLGAMLRRHRNFHECEDTVQEALLAASLQWPDEGVPDNPRGWLLTVASRRRIESSRREAARRRREDVSADPQLDDDVSPTESDDTLKLLFLCCHPSLTPSSQVALTLRAVGGLTTSEIARAYMVPDATMGQRISRAKQRIRDSGGEFTMPAGEEMEGRLAVVLHVLYLIFNEGYTASSGAALQRPDLTGEAIRLTRQLHELLTDHGEVSGLLALMLLTDARRAARTRPDGSLVTLSEQERSLWDRASIAEGSSLVTDSLAHAVLGAYQLQAAIAAVHDEAPDYEDTDWHQILVLYELLEHISPGPMVTLNRIVAAAMVEGPDVGLRHLDAAIVDPALAGHHRVDVIRGHLLEMSGDPEGAVGAYRRAALRALSLPEQRYLEDRAARLGTS